MKHLFLLILLVSFVIPTFAQEEITLDTIVEVRSGDTVRTMTVKEALEEFDAYVNTLDYAYKTEDGITVIPMSPEYLAIAKEQKELGDYYEEVEGRGGDLSYLWNKTFGDASKFAVYFEAGLTVSGGETDRSLDAHASAGASIFDNKVNIVSLNINAHNKEYGLSGSASLKVLFKTIWSAETDLQFEWSESYKQLVASASVPYGGIFRATVAVYVTGAIGVNGGINLSANGLGLAGIIEPYVELGTIVEAKPVDVYVADIEVECTLNLMRYRLPIRASVWWMPEIKKLCGYASIALELDTLDGKLDFVAHLLCWEVCRFTIFEWDPITQKIQLFKQTFKK